jgi:pimeloyl-ACP methyl ester carboxylesterase
MKRFGRFHKKNQGFFQLSRLFSKIGEQTTFNDQPALDSTAQSLPESTNIIHPTTGRHQLDVVYERFAKPQLNDLASSTNPSIYVRHEVGQEVWAGYIIEKVFEDPPTGFYAEGRISKCRTKPPVLVIRGYGSWYPFERVLEDTPDVFLAHFDRQLKSAEACGAVDWLKDSHLAGNQADIIGESLGGKVTQQLAAKYLEYIRSSVTFNSVGVSQELAHSSKAQNVFHYFTLGERYAFWANQGCYIPGICFQISKAGKNWKYNLTEFIIKTGSFPVKPAFFLNPFPYFIQILFSIFAQLILLSRHNALVLNHPRPVVRQVPLDEIQPPRKNIK